MLTQTPDGQATYLCAHCAVANVEELLVAGWNSAEVVQQMVFNRCGHFKDKSEDQSGRCGMCYGAITGLLTYVCIRNRMMKRGRLHSALNKLLKRFETKYGRVYSNSIYTHTPLNRMKKDGSIRCLHN